MCRLQTGVARRAAALRHRKSGPLAAPDDGPAAVGATSLPVEQGAGAAAHYGLDQPHGAPFPKAPATNFGPLGGLVLVAGEGGKAGRSVPVRHVDQPTETEHTSGTGDFQGAGHAASPNRTVWHAAQSPDWLFAS